MNMLKGFALLVVGFLLCAVVDRVNHKKTNDRVQIQQNAHPLLSRRLFIESPNDSIINFSSLRTQIRDRLQPYNNDISFYFEYMPTGTAIRVAGENQLVAASLIKLPLVMNLYHVAELERTRLEDSVKLLSTDLDSAFGHLYEKGAGTTLSLKELAHITLTESDNTAANAINRSIEGKLSMNEESLQGLDIDYDIENGRGVFSARSYSSILKCLYYSCYLNEDHSQEILNYLTQSAFNDRITKYLPGDIKVAHKIGVYNPGDINSDCGIVYIPKRPYIFCIMLHGAEEDTNPVMADTSKIVYDWLASH